MREAILIFLFAVVSCGGAEYPPITDFGPTNEYGAGVQRSIRLMAKSRPERKRTVKVLFYGQSITHQPWFFAVGDWLKAQYPNANIVYTNRAIGGYYSELLTRIAEADIMPIYPDLIIYQNYGSLSDIENIVARTRLRTTADILMQTDHPTVAEHMTEGTNAATAVTPDAFKNYVFLPGMVRRYGSELGDVRSLWKSYLQEYELDPTAVLRDHIHPDTPGDYLMAEFVKAYLRLDERFSDEDWSRAERNVKIPREKWTSLTIPFVGNKVDLVISSNGTSAIEVWIDGKRPSEFPELYAFTRPEFYPNGYVPCIVQVGSRATLREESWKATILESYMSNGTPFVRFAVTGSETGLDGEGTNRELFISNSRRVMLQPQDWLMLLWATVFPTLKPLEVGYEIKWESRFYGMDEFVPAVPDPTLETTVTVAQGLANGEHTLTLVGIDTAGIEAVRIFNPLARTQPEPPGEIHITSVGRKEGRLTIQASAGGRYVVESSESANGPWTGISSPQSERVFEVPANGNRGFLRLRKID